MSTALGTERQLLACRVSYPGHEQEGEAASEPWSAAGTGKKNHLLEGSLLQHTQVLPGLPWLQPAGSPRPSTSEISMKDLACDGLKPSPMLDGDEQMLGSSSASLRFCTSTQLQEENQTCSQHPSPFEPLLPRAPPSCFPPVQAPKLQPTIYSYHVRPSCQTQDKRAKQMSPQS